MSSPQPHFGVDTTILKCWQHPRIVFRITICASIGGFLFGYDTGIINGAYILIEDDLHLNKQWMSHIVSSTIGVAAIGSLFSGYISDGWGRKFALMLSTAIFVIAGFLMAFAMNGVTLLIGRMIAGIAVGIVSSVVPVYIAECAPSEIRGSLSVLYQLFVTLGILVSSIVAIVFHQRKDGWRYMLGLSVVPAVFQFILFSTLPQSPRYQVLKQDYEGATLTLQRLRNERNVDIEMKEIVYTLKEGHEIYNSDRGWISIFLTPHIRRALFIGCSLHVIQQLSGINVVIYYTADILKSAGFSRTDALISSVVPYTVNFLATFIGVWSIETLGRKRTLFASLLGMHIALLVITVSYLPAYINPIKTDAKYEVSYNVSGHCLNKSDCSLCIQDNACAFCGVHSGFDHYENPSCVHKHLKQNAIEFASEGRCSRDNSSDEYLGGPDMTYAYGYCPSVFAWMAVTGIILYVLTFAPGNGPLPWTLNAEIYPLWCRSNATAIATAVNWVCNYFLSHYYISMNDLIPPWATFLILAFVCLGATIFVARVIPKTNFYHLEEGEFVFMTKRERKSAINRLQEKVMDTEGTFVSWVQFTNPKTHEIADEGIYIGPRLYV